MGVWFPMCNHRQENIPGLQGWVSAQSEHSDTDRQMIHDCVGTLRSGQNNPRSLSDTSLGATTSVRAKAMDGRRGGRRHNEQLINRTLNSKTRRGFKGACWREIVLALSALLSFVNVTNVHFKLQLLNEWLVTKKKLSNFSIHAQSYTSK